MSLSNRRRVLAALGGLGGTFALAGCFRPMLAKDGRASTLLGRVELPPVDDRMGYYLHQSLRDRFGDTQVAEYRLEVSMRTETTGLGITQDDSITRIRLRAFANFRLFRTGEPRPVLTGAVTSESGYSSTSSLYATRRISETVERRLATDLGDRIARRIFAAAERDGLA